MGLKVSAGPYVLGGRGAYLEKSGLVGAPAPPGPARAALSRVGPRRRASRAARGPLRSFVSSLLASAGGCAPGRAGLRP
jgi:hypothetical protein